MIVQWLQMEHSFIVSPHCPRGGGLYLNMSTEEPWFLTRDFNEIVDNSEKSGGPVGAEETFCNVRSFLSQNDLFDLKHSGNFLSWRGKRHSHTVHCRPDRAMSNSAWIDLFLSCRSQYLQFEASDHRPLLTFLDPVRVKLKKCRQAISNWSREFQINSKKTIEDLRSKLEATMSAFDPRDDLIHDINLQLLKAVIEDDEGTAWFEEKEVFTVISQYYTKLFTSYSTNGSVVINKALFQKLTPEYERGTSQATLSVRNKRSHVRYSSG